MQAAFAPVSHSKTIFSLGSSRYSRPNACKPHAQATRQVNELINCDQASLFDTQQARGAPVCSIARSQEDRASNLVAVLLRYVPLHSLFIAYLQVDHSKTFDKPCICAEP